MDRGPTTFELNVVSRALPLLPTLQPRVYSIIATSPEQGALAANHTLKQVRLAFFVLRDAPIRKLGELHQYGVAGQFTSRGA